MGRSAFALIAALGLAGCSRSSPARPPGHVVVAITVDWEGAMFSSEGLDALDGLRDKLGAVPLTHFVSAAYFTKAEPDPDASAHLAGAVREGDELALHLHGWASLARASGIEPRLAPSFLTGTDQVLTFPDGDAGFDTDLDVYEISELRALVRTSKRLLQEARLPVSTSFRAGGYLATAKVLQAIRSEGLDVDSSATHADQFAAPKDTVLRQRISEVWPTVTATTSPFVVETPGGPILELPIAAIVDYVSTADVVATIERAHRALAAAPTTDVIVVIALHQETADEFAGKLVDAIAAVRARPDLAPSLQFTTIEKAAASVRARAAHPTRPDKATAPTGRAPSRGLSGHARFASIRFFTEGS